MRYMASKATSYRFTAATAERIEKLKDRREQSRTKVIEDAIWNMALQDGLLDEEAEENLDDLEGRHGGDAIVTFAILQNNLNVPVAINGEPTQGLRAQRLLSYAYFVANGPPAIDPNGEFPVLVRIPDTAISFTLDPVAAPGKIEMRLAELRERRNPFQPRTAASAFMNREIRRAAGIEVDDEEPGS